MHPTRLFPVLCALALAACTSNLPAPPPPAPAGAGEGASVDERLLVQRVSLELEAERPAEAAAQVEAVTRGVGGYVESATAREAKRVHLVLRIPAASLDSVLAAVSRLGEVEDRRVSALDVTEESTDLEARLQNLVAVRDRLRQHLQRAGGVQDVIAVERELARVQTEIDALEARLKRLRTDVAMSQVTLDIHRKRVLGPLGLLLAGLGWLIGKLFVIQ
ncbi:MAG TPA: DUF4349 domain-containing protein [Longimicrobiaceae bacterium]|nr:DUF4349 domain-containing protein [Longimicrobiaceae bacterium]